MRKLLVFLILLAIGLGAAWFFGESSMAGRMARVIEADPRIEATAVTPLREPSRIGVRVDTLDYQGPSGGIELPWAELWAAPYLPQDVTAMLPPSAVLTMPGGQVEADLQDASAHVRVSPVNGLAVGQAGLSSGPVDLNGIPAFEYARIEAHLGGLGNGAPRTAGAAYDIDLALQKLDPAALAPLGLALPPGAVPGAVSAEGQLRLFLTDAPGRGAWRGQAAAAVAPVGVESDGVQLSVGDLNAVIHGAVARGEDGWAQGRLYVDTADSQGFLQAAADAGLLPQAAVMLGSGFLSGLSEATSDDEAAEAGAPPLAEGSIRLSFDFRDGQTLLAGQPIGPAPRFP